MSNAIGTLFRLTTFGESHGLAIGGIIEGCPAGLVLDIDFIQQQLDKRKPGSYALASERKENDKVTLLSGVFEGKSTGTPIGFIIYNEDKQSADYDNVRCAYRPSHADYTYDMKYGFRDYRGGGRASARETACRVAAGAVAKLLLQHAGIRIKAYVSAIGNVKVQKKYTFAELEGEEFSALNCPEKQASEAMENLIAEVKAKGDTLGGVIHCVASGVPAGLGEPVFDKLQASLAKAMMSINAAKGFEYGEGFAAASMLGSEHNDALQAMKNVVNSVTNHSGGIQGGISNGEEIYFTVAFKPVATIKQAQQTVNNKNENVVLQMEGRHDTCVVPRAVAIVEAMTALTLADFMLLNRTAKL